ncbi:MAG: hypothetical protein NTX50_28235 [Candidatus Sumerlaeota bacterium]|nr:hypothetical protein [Candidatus Sumerlaeota bacterium]
MILETIPSATGLAFDPPTTFSNAGYLITCRIKQFRQQTKSSFLSRERDQCIYDELKAVAAECATAHWDGYDAVPVAKDTYRHALLFLKSMPTVPKPEISAEPDGCITMEWRKSSRCTLSVSISPSGELYYAALIGASSRCGTEIFLGIAPQAIIDLICQIESL